jgi:hypothetical protein
MNARGLTELVILTIGLQLNVLSDRTFAMMVIMALATTVMAAPVVNLLTRKSLLPEETVPDEHPLLQALPPPDWGDWVYLNGWVSQSRPPSEWSDWVALNAWGPAPASTAEAAASQEPPPAGHV